MRTFDCAIIGGGAAGFSAGVYAGRYKMKTTIFNKEFGGDTAKAGTIENWIGELEVDGYELMERMREHAKTMGVEIVDEEVKAVKKEGKCFVLTTDKGEYRAVSVVAAIGADRRKLGLPNEGELTSKGVHYCVTCDGPVYTGKTIAVIGGGDASVKGVALATEYVDKAYLIVRKGNLRAEPINQERLEKLGDKVEILFETEVKEIIAGDNGMFDKVKLTKEYNGSDILDVDGLFIEIGAVPNTGILKDLNVELDELNYIKTNNMMETSAPGLSAAGDIVNHFGHFKQDITASAMGAVAATSAYDHYKTHSEACAS